jgi:hypothetical protein
LERVFSWPEVAKEKTEGPEIPEWIGPEEKPKYILVTRERSVWRVSSERDQVWDMIQMKKLALSCERRPDANGRRSWEPGNATRMNGNWFHDIGNTLLHLPGLWCLVGIQIRSECCGEIL